MLLASTHKTSTQKTEDVFIAHLLDQDRFAEAYQLIKKENADLPATQYNLALCYCQVGDYREALMCLDKAQMLLATGNLKTNAEIDSLYKALSAHQNRLDTHKRAVTHQYIALYGILFNDAITRLKIDCWLQLEDYARVIDTATPIAYKNYHNISEALAIANKNMKNNERI